MEEQVGTPARTALWTWMCTAWRIWPGRFASCSAVTPRQRRDTELSYREMAAMSGYTHGVIGDYFTGKVLPPTHRLDVLVQLLGATRKEQRAFVAARDRVAPPASPALTWAFKWQVMGSNHRRLSRRFYREPLQAQRWMAVTRGNVAMGGWPAAQPLLNRERPQTLGHDRTPQD
jgi:hypothetical protein